MTNQFYAIDLPPLIAATAACVSCALLGNFLLLRRISLMGDAISHAVLPGIVISFLLFESRSTGWIFLGSAAAGVIASLLIDLIKDLGRLEGGAAMGVVFSLFFALGVLLMEQAAAQAVDLDADCLLHGQLESIFWFPPESISQLFSRATLSTIPFEIYSSFSILTISILFVFSFYKELTISSFDPLLATTLGYPSRIIHLLFITVVASAVVASFTIVGSILVIAMLICPAAIARLYTDRLKIQLLLSVFVSMIATVLGYLAGAFGPILLGFQNSVSAAGSITVMLGVLLTFAVVSSPRYGVLANLFKRARLYGSIIEENILAALFREHERGSRELLEEKAVAERIHEPLPVTVFFIWRLKRLGFISRLENEFRLTERGYLIASRVIRKHRLWEEYFVKEVGISPDHVHSSAEFLEHFTDNTLTKALADNHQLAEEDPHGRVIPKDYNKPG
jgi:manganese/zinc/iron transport system permease protein